LFSELELKNILHLCCIIFVESNDKWKNDKIVNQL